MNQSNAYQTIQQLRGMEQFKQLANKMLAIATNCRHQPKPRLPHFAFLADAGCGMTTHLKLFTQLLYELNLIYFEGDRKYFEVVMDKTAFASGGAFELMLATIHDVVGYRSQYCGVIGIEMDDWAECVDEHALRPLLSFAEDVLGQILIVFEITSRPNDDSSSLIQALSHEMPLETVRFPLPSTEDLCLYLCDFVSRRGFDMSNSAKDTVREIMPNLMLVKGFDGLQTLDNLADEIIYRFLSQENMRQNEIPAEIFSFINEENGYIARLSNRQRTRRHVIGF